LAQGLPDDAHSDKAFMRELVCRHSRTLGGHLLFRAGTTGFHFKTPRNHFTAPCHPLAILRVHLKTSFSHNSNWFRASEVSNGQRTTCTKTRPRTGFYEPSINVEDCPLHGGLPKGATSLTTVLDDHSPKPKLAGNEPDAKAILPEPRSVERAISYL
jgi:hypothetical protein